MIDLVTPLGHRSQAGGDRLGAPDRGMRPSQDGSGPWSRRGEHEAGDDGDERVVVGRAVTLPCTAKSAKGGDIHEVRRVGQPARDGNSAEAGR